MIKRCRQIPVVDNLHPSRKWIRLTKVLADVLVEFPLELIRVVVEWLGPWTTDDLLLQFADMPEIREYQVELMSSVKVPYFGCTDDGRVTFGTEARDSDVPFVYRHRQWMDNDMHSTVQLHAHPTHGTHVVHAFFCVRGMEGRKMEAVTATTLTSSIHPCNALLRGFLEFVGLDNVYGIVGVASGGRYRLVRLDDRVPRSEVSVDTLTDGNLDSIRRCVATYVGLWPTRFAELV